MTFSIIVGLICFLVYIYISPYITLFFYRKKAKKLGLNPVKEVQIRFPYGIPFFLDLAKANANHQVGEKVQEFFKRAGTKTIQRAIFGRFGILTCEPENIKALLATQFKDFGIGVRHYHLSPLLGDGIFTLDGAGWSHSRALLRPQFTRQQISRLSSLELHIQKVIEVANNNYDAGKSFDIQEIFFRFTLDSATEFLFGESVNSLDPQPKQDAARFAEAFNSAQEYCAKRARARSFAFLLNSKQFREWNDICHKFVDYYVGKALNTTEDKQERYIFLYALTEQTRDPIVLRNQCLNILLAGRDTTAATLSFSIYTLGRYPEIFNKLRKAILNEFGTGTQTISFESLKRLSYLQHFISEILRLYPIVPFNSRTAFKDTSLPRGGGPDGMSPILVEKGTLVGYSVSSMHRLEEYYGNDSAVFRPERWEGKSTSWEYLPFNGGPRICLGQQFALTEVSYVLVRLLQSFKRIIPEKSFADEPVQTISLTLSIFNGVIVKLVPDHQTKSDPL